ncbi:hypothetical protein IW136_006019, partial [Coemansia sp. RSA 678]
PAAKDYCNLAGNQGACARTGVFCYRLQVADVAATVPVGYWQEHRRAHVYCRVCQRVLCVWREDQREPADHSVLVLAHCDGLGEYGNEDDEIQGAAKLVCAVCSALLGNGHGLVPAGQVGAAGLAAQLNDLSVRRLEPLVIAKDTAMAQQV